MGTKGTLKDISKSKLEMTPMKKFSTAVIGATAIALGTFAAAAPAKAQSLAPVPGQSYTVNFDTDAAGNPLSAGTNISNQWQDYGLTISNADTDPNALDLMLFNSNCGPDFGIACSGGDTDLATGPFFGTAPQGNVLIISEDGDSSNPDDNANGGTITFSFTDAVSLNQLAILDFDDQDRGEGYIRAFTVDGLAGEYKMSEGNLLNPAYPGNNSIREYDFSGLAPESITSLEVVFPGSGAVSYLAFTGPSEEVPEPLTVLGLVTSGGFLAAARQKRRRKMES